MPAIHLSITQEPRRSQHLAQRPGWSDRPAQASTTVSQLTLTPGEARRRAQGPSHMIAAAACAGASPRRSLARRASGSAGLHRSARSSAHDRARTARGTRPSSGSRRHGSAAADARRVGAAEDGRAASGLEEGGAHGHAAAASGRHLAVHSLVGPPGDEVRGVLRGVELVARALHPLGACKKGG